MRMIITVLPAAGHVNPMIAIAQALAARGHKITFMTDPRYQNQLERLGFGFAPIHYSPGILDQTLAAFGRPLPRFPQLFWDRPQAGFFLELPQITTQLVSYFKQHQPDVLLTDYNFYAGGIAAEVCGIPYATFCAVVNALPSKDTPTFGALMDWQPPGHPERWLWPLTLWGSKQYLWLDDRVVNEVRKSYGLTPVDFPTFGVTPYLFIVPTTEAYEYPRADLPPQVMYVGPVTSSQRGDVDQDFLWEWLNDPRPTVYASLGTIVQHKQIFQMIIEVAQRADWKGILAVGKGQDLGAFQNVPENILLQSFVPQYDLLARVEAVISHGGNNTMNEALLHGKPLIVLPFTGDQPESAARIVKAGAGIRIYPQRLTRQKLATAIQKILSESTYRAAAQQIQASFKTTTGAESAALLVEMLGKTRKPLYRLPGMSPTLTEVDIKMLIRG